MPISADPRRLNRVQRARVERFYIRAMKLVSNEIRNDPSLEGDRERLQDFAVDALFSAARCYDPTKGLDFERYARMRILNSFRDARRAYMRPKNIFDRSIERIGSVTLALEQSA